jgi:hypothetical protein
MQSLISMQGFLAPLLTVLAKNVDHKEGDKLHIASMDIPQKLLEKSEYKELLANKIIPGLFDKICGENEREILGFCFTSEIYMRKADVKNMKDFDKKTIQALPKQEALMSSYEFANGRNYIDVDFIHREGKMANTKGEVIDCIRLERSTDFDGFNNQEKDSPVAGNGIFQDILKNYLSKKQAV